jgi:hypothetical protein
VAYLAGAPDGSLFTADRGDCLLLAGSDSWLTGTVALVARQ